MADFDHLVSVHNLFSGDDTVRIQRYIANEIDCERSSDCLVMNQFRNRQRRNEKHSELDRNDSSSSECAVLRETLCGIHCYLLHRSNELYRLSSGVATGSLSKFSSLVSGGESADDGKEEKKEAEPLSIDFGVSVIRWLPYGEEPLFETLRDEIIHNEDSTVTEEGYERMEVECAEKIKSELFADYKLDELMGFKFYSDYTTDCANLRKAHWESMTKKRKKRYYRWARTIYRASLRQATPIPIQKGGAQIGTRLYHGLSKLFRMDQELPTYFGPLSTTVSLAVSDSFSEQKGLRLNIQSGYADSMRRCLGIDMRPISCFKREQEILLVDQPIPIQSTNAYKPNDDVSINHFLYSLKTRSTKIRDPKEFYSKLGIKSKKKWIGSIIKHQQLYAKSKYGGKLVIGRLVEELHKLEVFYRSKYFSSKFIDIIGVDENECISLNIDVPDSLDTAVPDGNRFTVWSPLRRKRQDLLEVFEFMVQNVTNGVPEKLRTPKNYRFSEWNKFQIPIRNHMAPSPRIRAVQFDDALQRIQIAVPLPSVFDTPIPIKTVQIPFVTAEGIRCEETDPFQINERVQLLPFDEFRRSGGKLNVHSTSSIIIGKGGGINGSSCGLRRESKYGNQCHLKYGQIIGNTEEQNGSEIGNGAGGGVIVLSAAGSIVNDGILECEPTETDVFSGGTLCIVTNNRFVNNGRISCGEDGVIHIRCRQLVNIGLIETIPTVSIIDRWNEKAKPERMEMHVVDHRGHSNQGTDDDALYHPRCLLEGDNTRYKSAQDKEPVNEDWIIFGIESNGYCIRSIGIRNWWSDWAVKRILIQGSRDNQEYENWIEIGEIEQMSDDLQFFEGDMASSLYALEKKWKFYRLCFTENHGGPMNEFHEFLLLGCEY